jgi:hypothetical protein
VGRVARAEKGLLGFCGSKGSKPAIIGPRKLNQSARGMAGIDILLRPSRAAIRSLVLPPFYSPSTKDRRCRT